MKPVAIIIAKYGAILLIWVLLLWWALFFSPIDVPEYIPHTPVKVYGLALIAFTLTIIILSQKETLRKMPALNIMQLVIVGTATCFFMEALFQFVLSFTYDSGKLHHFISGVAVTTIYGLVLSFFVAFQLKTKKTGVLVLLIAVLLIIINLLTIAFPSLRLR